MLHVTGKLSTALHEGNTDIDHRPVVACALDLPMSTSFMRSGKPKFHVTLKIGDDERKTQIPSNATQRPEWNEQFYFVRRTLLSLERSDLMFAIAL